MSRWQEVSPEVRHLLAAYCDGSASTEQIQRLEALLDADPAAQRLLLDALQLEADMHMLIRGDGALAKSLHALTTGPSGDNSSPRNVAASASVRSVSPMLGFLDRVLHFSGETRVATALTWLVMAFLCSGIVLTIFFCVLLVYRGAGVNAHIDARQVAGSKEPGAGSKEQGAATKEQGAATKEQESPVNAELTAPSPVLPASPTVARLVRAYDCRWAIGSHSPHPGDDLEPGRKLVLLSGLADIMFESGVRSVLQGPATLEVASKSSAFLRQGRVTVTVIDPDAHGFVIATPGMKYTDLGTEFGVFVAKDGAQEMHVFRGRVRAEFLIPQLASPPLLLTANQAIRVVRPRLPSGELGPMERIAADNRQFVFVPEPFPLFSTGVGLAVGAADPHWTITKVSTDPNFLPRNAIVCSVGHQYERNVRESSQWISTAAVCENMVGGCRWTYRTDFDLTTYDPATARIEGRFSVDDFLIELRLNGISLPLPAGSHDEAALTKMMPLCIDRGFVAGRNKLEVVVENVINLALGPQDRDSAMALNLELHGTAQRRAGGARRSLLE